MKKAKLLHSEISYEIAKIGHTQTIVIGDSGLPVPEGVKRIDLALCEGIPTALETLEAVLAELQVEKVILAQEIRTANPAVERKFLEQVEGVPVDYVPHKRFKELTAQARCVIRTGEMSSYANIILQSGVTF